MDLDLALNPRTRGRAQSPITAEIVRELNTADLALLESTPRGVTTSSLQRIRDSHHSIAQLLAAGHSNNEVCAITGYSPSRVSILKGDPAFQELVEFYRANAKERNIDLIADGVAKATFARNLALDVVIEDLEDGKLRGLDALEAATKLGDRTGLVAQSRQTTVNVSMNYAETLAARRRRDSEPGALKALPSGESESAVPSAPPSIIEGELISDGEALK